MTSVVSFFYTTSCGVVRTPSTPALLSSLAVSPICCVGIYSTTHIQTVTRSIGLSASNRPHKLCMHDVLLQFWGCLSVDTDRRGGLFIFLKVRIGAMMITTDTSNSQNSQSTVQYAVVWCDLPFSSYPIPLAGGEQQVT